MLKSKKKYYGQSYTFESMNACPLRTHYMLSL